MNIGDRVRILPGWWVGTFTSKGTETGTIERQHDHNGTWWVRLDDGRTVSTAKASVVPA